MSRSPLLLGLCGTGLLVQTIACVPQSPTPRALRDRFTYSDSCLRPAASYSSGFAGRVYLLWAAACVPQPPTPQALRDRSTYLDSCLRPAVPCEVHAAGKSVRKNIPHITQTNMCGTKDNAGGSDDAAFYLLRQKKTAVCQLCDVYILGIPLSCFINLAKPSSLF